MPRLPHYGVLGDAIQGRLRNRASSAISRSELHRSNAC